MADKPNVSQVNPWPNPWALPDAKASADLPDLGMMMAGPLSLMRAWADVNRATVTWLPATWLVAASPFFWAPPFWVGALMSGGAAHPQGGVAGSTATAREAAAAPARTLVPRPPPQPTAPARSAAAPKPAAGKTAPGKAPARTRRPATGT